MRILGSIRREPLHRMHSASAALGLALWLVACGDKPAQDEAASAPPTKVDSAAESKAADSAAGEAEEDGPAADEGQPSKLDAGTPEAGAAEEDPAEEDPAEEDTAEEDTAEEDAAEDGEAGDAAPDPKALLGEARSKKTSDERAKEALQQAEEAGAKPRELAKAANARGEALHATPERAAEFFTWAADKDPKYPEPVFNLAKQAAVSGDVAEVKKRLTEVKARKGNKLLQQIEFDPMWEIVKDDPEVRALLEG